MKLLFLVGTLSGGGVPNILHLLVKGLYKENICSDICVCQDNEIPKHWLMEGVNIFSLRGKKKFFRISNARQINNILSKYRYSHIISFSTYTNLLATFIRIPINTPLICIQHNNLSTMFGDSFRGWIKKRIICQSFKKATVSVGVSKGVKQDMENLCDTASKQTHFGCIHNGLDLSKIQIKSNQQLPFSHQRIFASKPVILSAGRLSRQKNYKDLLHHFAVSKIKKEAQLVIIGDGPDRKALEELIHTYKLNESVHLLGWVENPYMYMRKAAVFLLCSLWEGLPTVLIEAMCCGAPIVSFDCPSGPKEIIDHEGNGFLIELGKFDILLNKIDNILNNKYELQQIQKNGFKTIAQFSMERMIGDYIKLFKKTSHIKGFLAK